MRPNPQIPPDLVTFTEEILNEKLHFLCSVELTTKGKYLVPVTITNTDAAATVKESEKAKTKY